MAQGIGRILNQKSHDQNCNVLFDVTTKQARILEFEGGGARKFGKLVGRQSFRWGANFSLLLFLNEVDLETTIQNAI